MTYDHYSFLAVELDDDGVLRITMNRPEKLNACDATGHGELGQIWLDFDADPAAKVALITGAGRAFSAGGDLSGATIGDPAGVEATMRHDQAIVHNMARCKKPIVSAINGPAVGAGLAVGVLADISIAGESAKLIDGHTKLGVVAGDHAALLWPLLMSLAKAKYYLLLCEALSGAEAERVGLVSRCVSDAELQETALDIARRLARSSQWALRGTKAALNHWLNANMTVFDSSLWMEAVSFFLPDAAEGVAAFTEKRSPVFPSASTHKLAGDLA